MTNTITITLTRTTYDGTPETLPVKGIPVVVTLGNGVFFGITARNSLRPNEGEEEGTRYWEKEYCNTIISPGDNWFLWSDFEKQILNPATTGISLIAAERAKHAAKGYDAAHDAEHQDSELAWAACYYAMPKTVRQTPYNRSNAIGPADMFHETGWLWLHAKRDVKTRKEQLTIAGALIVAELDRLTAEEKKGAAV